MTSEKIRKLEFESDESYVATHEDFKCSMLQEIAAQLAELNEHFRKADESVFGVKDRKE
jgi:hypothetical protein